MKKSSASLLLTAAAALSALSEVAVAPAVGANPQPPGATCESEVYEWSGDQLLVPWQPSFQAGEIPGPAVGESLVVTGVRYSAWDEYPEGTVPSRADADQPDETFGITIGGVQVGGLSADLPDTLAEGAPTVWYSGVHSGSLGGAGTAIDGGILLVRHASLYGLGTEPANSVHASGLTVTVDRCVTPQETTTTGAPTTTADPTTTAVPTTAAPTTTVESAGPTTAAPTTTRAATAPTAAVSAAATLPATGRGSGTLLLVASICGAVGAALLIVRRRPASAVD